METGDEGPRPSIPSPEATRTPERRYTRQEVIGAVHSAQELINTSITESSPPEQQWLRQSVNDAMAKTIDHPDGVRETFTNQFDNVDTGEVGFYTQAEGVPVEGILGHLRTRIQELGRSNPAERKRLMEIGNVIYRNSASYSELYDMTGPGYLNRVRQEANLISGDNRRNTSDGTQEGDYFAAENALRGNPDVPGYRGRSEKAWLTKADRVLNGRRELILPDEEIAEAAEAEEPEELAEATTPERRPPPLPPPLPAEIPTESAAEDADEATPTPVTTVDEIRARTITIGNRTEGLRKSAAEMAEEQLRNEQRRGSKWNPLNWPRKFHLQVAEEYFRQKYIDRATKAMKEHSNSYLEMDLVKNVGVKATANIDDERAAGKAAIDQLNSGVKLEGQEVQSLDKASPLYTDLMTNIVRPMVEGGLNQGQIQQKLREFVIANQADPQIKAIFGRDATQYGRLAEYFATDLTEVADSVRQDVAANRFALDQLDQHINLQFANYHWAANTEANFNKADKVIAWAEKSRLTGWLINPATVGAAASLAAFGLTRLPGMAGTASQAVIPFVGALAGGVFAGLRRNMDIKRDMAAHRVDMANGKVITDPKEQKRRQALENFKYNTATTTDLLKGISDSSRDLGTESNRQQLVNKVAEIQARLDFSTTKKVDLVTFESSTKVEQGRMGLVQAMIEAKRALTAQGGLDEAEVSRLVNHEVGQWNQRFMDNKDQQDRDFKGYRMRQSLKAGAFGGVAGLAGSLVSQQAFAEIGRHLPGATEIPVLGSLFKKGDTVGEKLYQGVSKAVATGDINEALVNPFGTTRAEGFARDISENLYQNPSAKVDIAPGIQMISDASHHISFQDAAGNAISTPGIELAADGHLIQQGTVDQLPSNLRSIFAQPEWQTQVHTDTGYNINKAKDLFIAPGSQDLGNGINLKVGLDHAAILTDPLGQTIETPPMTLTQDGKLMVTGGFDKLPANVKTLLGTEWQHSATTNPTFNLHEQVAQALASGNHETITHGNVVIDVDPAHKTFSMIMGDASDTARVPNYQLHGTIRPDGTLAFDPNMAGNERVIWSEVQNQIGKESWGVQKFEIPGDTIPGVDQTRDVNINDWLKDHGEQAKRDIWHDNSTPMHMENGRLVGADGKELQFYRRVQPDGSVVLDMKDIYSRMTPAGGVNWDQTIDNTYNRLLKDITTNPDGSHSFKNMQILITPNEAADAARQVIAIPVPENGQVVVPKELTSMLFKHNPDGSLVLDPNNFNNPAQAVKFLEVAHGDFDPDGNLIRRDVISTTVGDNFNGTVPIVVPGEPTITPPHNGFVLTPPPADELTPPADKTFTEFAPPEAIQLEQAPMIPFPFAPRYPLEPMKPIQPPPPPPRPPYGYGYGAGGTETRPDLTPSEERDVHAPADEVLETSTPTVVSTPEVPTDRTDTVDRTDREVTIDSSLTELDRYLTDEARSPIHPDSRAEAIASAKEFVLGPEIGDAEAAGGLDRLTATKLFQEIVEWLKTNSIPALEADDPSTDPELKTYTQMIAELVYYGQPADIVSKRSNLLAKFAQQATTKGLFDFKNQGDPAQNIYALAILYEKVKDLRMAP